MTGQRRSSAWSLLDRLTNTEAGIGARRRRSGTDDDGCHGSLGRDLENLLNTRCRVLTPPVRHPNLQRSLLVYGLRDLVTVNLIDAQSKQDFAEEVQRLIRRFEPRLTRVQVSFPQQTEAATRSLRFRIEALVLQDATLEPVIFNSVLEPGSCSVSIEEARYV